MLSLFCPTLCARANFQQPTAQGASELSEYALRECSEKLLTHQDQDIKAIIYVIDECPITAGTLSLRKSVMKADEVSRLGIELKKERSSARIWGNIGVAVEGKGTPPLAFAK